MAHITQGSIKTSQQISNIRESGKYLNELLLILRDKTKAWIATIELEFIAEHFIQTHTLSWAFKWYDWFPANLCLSLNDCVVHGIPDGTILKNGDLLKIDAGLIYERWYSDSAISVVVWWEFANPTAYDLIKTTKNALEAGIQTIQPDKDMFSYWATVNEIVKESWYKVIKDLTWHGVWTAVHERPYIFNYPHPDLRKQFYKPGMVLCFEPITAIISNNFYEKPWDEGLYTVHGDLWAQREYMLLITDEGYEILSGVIDFE